MCYHDSCYPKTWMHSTLRSCTKSNFFISLWTFHSLYTAVNIHWNTAKKRMVPCTHSSQTFVVQYNEHFVSEKRETQWQQLQYFHEKSHNHAFTRFHFQCRFIYQILVFFNILPDKIEKLPFFIFQRLVSLIHQVNGKLIVVPSSTHDLNNTGTIYWSITHAACKAGVFDRNPFWSISHTRLKCIFSFCKYRVVQQYNNTKWLVVCLQLPATWA